jgi:menaquinol-cytochrome c reductase iron-sulfur subunit
MREPDDERGESEPPREDDERRRFLLGVMGAAGAATALLLLTPPVSFLVKPLRRRAPEVWRPVGAVSDFPFDETVTLRVRDETAPAWAGLVADDAVHLRRDEKAGFVALSAYCTHVGCPVRWVAGAQMFFCPCHGGAFFKDGTVAAGPPPRPLERHGVRVREGLVEISNRRRPDRRAHRA